MNAPISSFLSTASSTITFLTCCFREVAMSNCGATSAMRKCLSRPPTSTVICVAVARKGKAPWTAAAASVLPFQANRRASGFATRSFVGGTMINGRPAESAVSSAASWPPSSFWGSGCSRTVRSWKRAAHGRTSRDRPSTTTKS